MTRKRHTGISAQWKAGMHRWEDAEALFRAQRWRGAMYMAGYAVECRLKVKLMQQWQCRHLSDLEDKLLARGIKESPFSHNLALMLKLAGGWDRLRQNQPMWAHFIDVNRWAPAWRYDPDLSSAKEAEEFLSAIKDVAGWIDNNL